MSSYGKRAVSGDLKFGKDVTGDVKATPFTSHTSRPVRPFWAPAAAARRGGHVWQRFLVGWRRIEANTGGSKTVFFRMVDLGLWCKTLGKTMVVRDGPASKSMAGHDF